MLKYPMELIQSYYYILNNNMIKNYLDVFKLSTVRATVEERSSSSPTNKNIILNLLNFK